MIFRVAFKETPKSKYRIHENLSYTDMLKFFSIHKNVYEMKIYKSQDDSIWERDLFFINGKLAKDQSGSSTIRMETPPFSIIELFEKLANVAPSRKENLDQLTQDILAGEDISKPKLRLIEKKDTDRNC